MLSFCYLYFSKILPHKNFKHFFGFILFLENLEIVFSRRFKNLQQQWKIKFLQKKKNGLFFFNPKKNISLENS